MLLSSLKKIIQYFEVSFAKIKSKININNGFFTLNPRYDIALILDPSSPYIPMY